MPTKIEWTNETWNPVVGCSKVSPGCKNCYAERMAYRLGCMGKPYYDMVQEGGGWNGKVELVKGVLDKPLHWRKPRKVFVCSMSDLFHEAVPDEFIWRVFRKMETASWHTFQVLTKRPERMAALLDDYLLNVGERQPGGHIWLGTSVENQKWAAKRIPLLLQVSAAVRFVSCEPLLGPVEDLCRGFRGAYYCLLLCHWLIIGCESGPKRRPCKLEWVKRLIDQAHAANVPVFVKQLDINGRVSHNPEEWPEWARRREYPSEIRA